MSELETTILDAATHVFSRYGVQRSSMVDLCKEAGVSRQTLYNRFRNKDDVLRGLIGRYTDLAIAEIRSELDRTPDIGDRLDLIFDRMVLRGFDTIQTTPNAQDFIEGVNATSQEALAQSAERFRSIIAEVLSPYRPQLAAAGLDLSALSACLQYSAKCAGMQTQDRAQLLTHLQTLRQLCLTAALPQASGRSPQRNEDHGHRT